jgi:hypothetical protein
MPYPTLMPYALAAGVGLLYYRRIRRHIGRQRWQPRRAYARIAFVGLAAAGLLAAGLANPSLRVGIGLGLLAGAAAGVAGMRWTRLVPGEDGSHAYIPNPWIGGALALLLVGRLAWRTWRAGDLAQGAVPVHASPLTLGIAATLVGYYLVYGVLLARRMRAEGAAAAP